MMAPSLLDLPASEAPTTPRPLEHAAARRRRLGQFFTPRWVAEAIVERHFSGLASVRKVLQTYPEFESRGAGVWRRVRH